LTSSEFDASEESESLDDSKDSDEIWGFLVDRLVVIMFDGCGRLVGRE
jgi:hypothetical protein